MQFEPWVTLQTLSIKTVGNLCHFLNTDGFFLWGSSSYNNFGKQWWWLFGIWCFLFEQLALLVQLLETKTGFLFSSLCGKQPWVSFICGYGRPQHQPLYIWSWDDGVPLPVMSCLIAKIKCKEPIAITYILPVLQSICEDRDCNMVKWILAEMPAELLATKIWIIVFKDFQRAFCNQIL